MGIGASFGKTVQQNYYLCLKEVNQYGVDKAMGVYNFCLTQSIIFPV